VFLIDKMLRKFKTSNKKFERAKYFQQVGNTQNKENNHFFYIKSVTDKHG
jgi:hypothetical protein